MGPTRLLIVTGLAAFAPMAACVHADAAGETIAGPIPADVERVLDGDTFVAVAHVWPGHAVRVSVRIRGIDAPETRSRCAAERDAARAARTMLGALLAQGRVSLVNVGGGKYYGRVLADVVAADGREAARVLLDGGLARPYDGGKRRAYCGLP